MRKIGFVILTIIMLASISGCSKTAGRGAEDLALDIRTDYLAAERLVMVADIRADYGDRVYDFGVRYTAGGEGGIIELLSPDEVAGVTAEIAPGSVTLVYDGARLDTGSLTGNGVSPLEALPLLLTQWREGYIRLCGFEKLGDSDAVAIETDIAETTVQKTWFDAKTLLPLRAELYEGGVMVIACTFDNVIIED